ncbi:hypothetical protein ELP57_31115, partial [Klebsiella pneumoniae]|nr:hypothetical protein [Klebsiella pneumoniae]
MSYLPFCTYLLKVSLGVSVFKHKTKRWRLPMIAITGATGQLGHYVITVSYTHLTLPTKLEV